MYLQFATLEVRCARWQPVARPPQPFAAAKIRERKSIDMQIDGQIGTE